MITVAWGGNFEGSLSPKPDSAVNPFFLLPASLRYLHCFEQLCSCTTRVRHCIALIRAFLHIRAHKVKDARSGALPGDLMSVIFQEELT
jgi:hypothetical protein